MIYTKLLKRLFDILFSIFSLILFSPLFVLIALFIKFDTPGTIFYRAERVGKDGNLFRLIKFRSMIVGASDNGPGITRSGDARVTRVGYWLRKFKLDEIPQLINIVKGEMSLVGPRPEDARYVAFYTPEQREVLRVLPGITSPASLKYRHEEQMLSNSDWEYNYIHDLMPKKLQIDLEYIRTQTLAKDMDIIWETILAIFK